MLESVVEANRERDLYLSDGLHVYYVPLLWCDAWSFTQGHTGGLDWTPEHAEFSSGPEVYCYAPTHLEANSHVDTMFVLVERLQRMDELTEEQARYVHPELFNYLEIIKNAS